MRTTLIISICPLILFMLSCDKSIVPPEQVSVNMYDTLNARFVPPVSMITSGPAEGQVIQSADATFRWSGEASVGSFYYSLDNSLPIWTMSRETTYTELDEGPHAFSLRGVHTNGQTQEAWHLRSFAVNAVKGPAIMIRPRAQTRKVNDQFDCTIWAEEVFALMGSKVTIQFDKNYLNVVSSPLEGDFLRKNNGTTPPFSPQVDVSNGRIFIELVVFGGNPRGADGSGVLATVRFKAIKAGTTRVSFLTSDLETAFRDTLNAKIRINDFVNGNVLIN